MKEFMLLIRNQVDHQSAWTKDVHDAFLKKCESYIDDLRTHGHLISAQPLVREGMMISGSEGAWTAGSFSDTREVIVGYYHVRAADLQQAVSIAKRNPEFSYSTSARIEVRPVKMKEETTRFEYPSGG